MAERAGAAGSSTPARHGKCRPAEQILAGFVRDGDTVVIDAAAGGEGVTLTTEPSEAEAAATNGRASAAPAEA